MHNNDLKLVNKPRAGAMAAAAHVASALGEEKCILFVNWSRPEVLGGARREQQSSAHFPARAPPLGLRPSRKGRCRSPWRAQH